MIERAAAEIADQVERRNGFVARMPHAVQRAGERDVVDVVARRLRERARLPPARHAAVDEFRIALEANVGPETQTFHHAGTETFDQRIGFLDQLQRGFDGFRLLEVERHAAAAAIGHFVFRRHASALAVDADDIRAHVGEQHGGERPRTDACEFHDANALQRTHVLFLP